MPDKLILIGRVAGAFGVKGEMRITAYGDDPASLLAYRDLKRKDGSPALTVVSGRAAKGELIAKVKELDVKEAVDALRGLELYVPRDALPPTEDDEFYLTDLIGLRAETAAGEVLGVVKAVPNFRAGDILEIAPPLGASFYVPFTLAAVPEVRLAEGVVIVAPPVEEDETENPT